jgi:hypothetical protein
MADAKTPVTFAKDWSWHSIEVTIDFTAGVEAELTPDQLAKAKADGVLKGEADGDGNAAASAPRRAGKA